MAKDTALPKFEDYKAPWEVSDDGTEIPEAEQQIDTTKLKKYLHNLLSDKVKAQEKVTTVTAERDAAKTELNAKLREGEDAGATAKREHAEALAAAKAEGALAAARLEAALSVEGITPAQARRLAKRLTGTTPDELEADAKELAEDLNLGKPVEESTPLVPGRPRTPRAAGDPNPTDTSGLPDPNDAAAIERLFGGRI